MNEVELDVLARGDVQDLIRVLFGQLGQRIELVGGQLAVRDFDALHTRRIPHRDRALGELTGRERQGLRLLAVVALPVVVALAIGPAAQARLGEQLLLDLPLLAQFDLSLENVDLARPVFAHLAS